MLVACVRTSLVNWDGSGKMERSSEQGGMFTIIPSDLALSSQFCILSVMVVVIEFRQICNNDSVAISRRIENFLVCNCELKTSFDQQCRQVGTPLNQMP